MKKKMLVANLCILLIMFSSVCMASNITEVVGDVGMKSPGEFSTIVSTILGVIQFAAYVIAISMLIYVGVKYTMAAADTRASLKGAMVKYVVGAFLIAAASTVISWIYNFANNAS